MSLTQQTGLFMKERKHKQMIRWKHLVTRPLRFSPLQMLGSVRLLNSAAQTQVLFKDNGLYVASVSHFP